MSINVYFQSAIQQAAGFVRKERMDCGRQFFDYSIDGIRINKDDRGCYFMGLPNTGDKVPEQLLELIEVISCYQELHCDQHREAGVYRYQSAEAELEYERDNGSRYQPPTQRLIVKVKAKNMGDIAELVRQIKAGVIRPDQSYEVPQDGLSGQELRERLVELEFELDNARGAGWQLGNRAALLVDVRSQLSFLCIGLKGNGFPLMRRGKMIAALNKIIDYSKPANEG